MAQQGIECVKAVSSWRPRAPLRPGIVRRAQRVPVGWGGGTGICSHPRPAVRSPASGHGLLISTRHIARHSERLGRQTTARRPPVRSQVKAGVQLCCQSRACARRGASHPVRAGGRRGRGRGKGRGDAQMTSRMWICSIATTICSKAGGRAGRNLKSKSAKGGSHNGATCPTVKQRVGIHCGKNRPLEPNSSLFRSWESKVQQCPRTDGAQPTVYHKAYALVPLPRVGA